MYHFTAEAHVLLHGNTINNILFTAVGRQMSGFEPPLRCFWEFSFVFSVLLGGLLGNVVLLAAAIGLQMSGFGPSLFPLSVLFFALLSVLFF